MGKEMDITSTVMVKELLCGLVSGLVSVTICHPLDVIRTRMNIMGGTQDPKTVKKYTNITETVKTVWRQEGWRGFYGGYSITVILIPFYNSVYFPIYNYVGKHLKDERNCGTTLQAVVGAMIAGSISNTLTNPILVMRTRFMVQALHPPSSQYGKVSLLSAYKKMIETVKWYQPSYRSLMKGWAISMFGMLHAVVYFPIYENIKKYFAGENQKQLKAWQVLFASIISKIMACLATYPHVVVRAIMQDDRARNPGTVAVIKQIYGRSGLRGFYSGLKPDLIRILPNNAIVFVLYEFTKKHLM